jgi:hypothetical protein
MRTKCFARKVPLILARIGQIRAEDTNVGRTQIFQQINEEDKLY